MKKTKLISIFIAATLLVSMFVSLFVNAEGTLLTKNGEELILNSKKNLESGDYNEAYISAYEAYKNNTSSIEAVLSLAKAEKALGTKKSAANTLLTAFGNGIISDEATDFLCGILKDISTEDSVKLLSLAAKTVNNDVLVKIRARVFASPVNFENVEAENLFRNALSRETGDIYQEELSEINQVTVVGKHMWTNLGINSENYSNVMKDGNTYSYEINGAVEYLPQNVLPLGDFAKMSNLKNLTVYARTVSNFDRLSDLKSLNNLTVSMSGLNSLSGMDKLTEITTLNLQNNNISDISQLSSLSKLETLYIDNNNIVDISPISESFNLKNITLNNNAKLFDLEPLNVINNNQMFVYGNFENTAVHYYANVSNLLYKIQVPERTPRYNKYSIANLYDEYCSVLGITGKSNCIDDTDLLQNKLKLLNSTNTVNKLIVYNCEGVGYDIWQKHVYDFDAVLKYTDLMIPFSAPNPATTEKSQATMLSGVETDTLAADNVFTKLKQAGKKVAVIFSGELTFELDSGISKFACENDSEAANKAIEIYNSYDAVFIFANDYDTELRKTAPEADSALNTLYNSMNLYGRICEKAKASGISSVVAFTSSHGSCIGADYKGFSGWNFPEDQNVMTYFSIFN